VDPSDSLSRSGLEGNGAGPAKETRSPLFALGGGPDTLGDQQAARWGNPSGRLSFGESDISDYRFSVHPMHTRIRVQYVL